MSHVSTMTDLPCYITMTLPFHYENLYLQKEHFLFPIYPAFSLYATVSLTLLPMGDHPCPCVISFNYYYCQFTSPQEVASVVLSILHVPHHLKSFSRWTLTWLPLITDFVFASLCLTMLCSVQRWVERLLSVMMVLFSCLITKKLISHRACHDFLLDPFVITSIELECVIKIWL